MFRVRPPSPAALALAVTLACVAALAPSRAGTPVQDVAGIERGRILFEQRWSVAPSGLGRWGRGPTSNGETCLDCHAGAGRGSPPASAEVPLRQGVLRLSQRVGALLLPHPAYGNQLQYQGVLGKVPGEGEVHVEWHEHVITLADGTRASLRRPVLHLTGLPFGELSADTLVSLRLAPALGGLGLLEDVSATTLARVAAGQRAAGVSGRAHLVPDAGGGEPVTGRFGHKAMQPDLRARAAGALFMDLGITSSHFPAHDCPPVQWECARLAAGESREIEDAEIADLVLYLRALPAPASALREPAAAGEGARLFTAAGCAACHLPELGREGYAEPVRAYTDLLLHDLGPGLSDGRPEGAAEGGEWRTAPLWGLGAYLARAAHAGLLHDGRARTIAEAILWHDGEARAARDAYGRMSARQSEALAAFVESL